MAVAVICEFNPFHNGHKYLIDTVKRLTGEPILCVMSGSFVQRGEAAVCSKFERAETALKNGADLVVELPTAYAVSCAQRFAQGGVSIAKSFGSVDKLAFGCEADSLEALKEAANALDNFDVNSRVTEKMSKGAYYPQAFESAVREVLGDEAADVLTLPNNILAVEYLRAIKGSGIEPLPVKRTGVSHDSDIISGDFVSASKLRGMLRRGEDVSHFVPEVPKSITYPENLERAVLFKLRTMTAENLGRLPEVSEGLEHRFVNAVAEYNSIEEILFAVKTKRYTLARLRRIICCAALGITEELQSRKAEYARVLGFTAEGEKMLKTCSFEIVTSVAKTMREEGKNVDFLCRDILATDLAALAYKSVKPCGSDYRTKIICYNCR